MTGTRAPGRWPRQRPAATAARRRPRRSSGSADVGQAEVELGEGGDPVGVVGEGRLPRGRTGVRRGADRPETVERAGGRRAPGPRPRRSPRPAPPARDAGRRPPRGPGSARSRSSRCRRGRARRHRARPGAPRRATGRRARSRRTATWSATRGSPGRAARRRARGAGRPRRAAARGSGPSARASSWPDAGGAPGRDPPPRAGRHAPRRRSRSCSRFADPPRGLPSATGPGHGSRSADARTLPTAEGSAPPRSRSCGSRLARSLRSGGPGRSIVWRPTLAVRPRPATARHAGTGQTGMRTDLQDQNAFLSKRCAMLRHSRCHMHGE